MDKMTAVRFVALGLAMKRVGLAVASRFPFQTTSQTRRNFCATSITSASPQTSTTFM